jgi:hypothetical protein
MTDCEVCGNCVTLGETCDHPKNGYCALFRLQAKNDILLLRREVAGAIPGLWRQINKLSPDQIERAKDLLS